MKRPTRVTPKKKAKTPRKPQVLAGWQDAFIETLRDWPNVSQAAKKIGVSRWEVYRTLKEDAGFRQRFDEARRIGIEAIEDEAIDQTRSNPTLMIFMLKNLKPEVYADRHIVETWQDRVVTLLRERKITPAEVIDELGHDVAADLINAAGLSSGENGETRTTGADGGAD